MFITTQNEIQSLMPTARWDRPQQLFGYLEEEESVALEPLLGPALYGRLLSEYDRLRVEYGDITATTVRPTGKAREDARLAHADVTERLEQIREGRYRETFTAPEPGEKDVPEADMQTMRLIRICQQIEFYRMLSHKAGLLTVSFNEGGGMNVVTADGYDPAEEKAKDRVVKDAFMSAGRATDSLLLFLEADAKGGRLFTDLWQEADAFYLHRDLLFQTAKVLNEYLDIRGERMAYVQLVRDIRFCQNTYLRPRIGAKLLKAVIAFANTAPRRIQERIVDDGDGIQINPDEGTQYRSGGQIRMYSTDENGDVHVVVDEDESVPQGFSDTAGEELLSLLRTALAFYVESRRVSLEPARERLARRDSMTDAQQAMAMACAFIEENLDALGEAAVGTPIYNAVRAREEQAELDARNAVASRRRICCERTEQNRKKLFTAFPATHIRPEHK
ncbi:MAG: hypothetical protein J6Y33_03460 [Prevotella sp.]|nr:hypothetical protein [Prevotella sp.]